MTHNRRAFEHQETAIIYHWAGSQSHIRQIQASIEWLEKTAGRLSDPSLAAARQLNDDTLRRLREDLRARTMFLERANRLVAMLTETEREMLDMFFVRHMSREEIAREFKCTCSNVDLNVRNAYLLMCRCLIALEAELPTGFAMLKEEAE